MQKTSSFIQSRETGLSSVCITSRDQLSFSTWVAPSTALTSSTKFRYTGSSIQITESKRPSSLAISIASVALGATSLERHFTLDRTMYGSDQAASITPEGFENLIKSVRKVENACKGILEKKVLDIEIPVAKKLRNHLNKNK